MPAMPPDRPGCRKAPGGPRPLPNAAAIRLCLVPESAPPYDSEVASMGPKTRRLPVWAPPGGEPGDGAPEYQEPGQEKGYRDVPAGWPDRFAQVLAETLAGSRPPRQLVPWTTQQALDRIQRLGPRLASAQRPRVRRVVTSLPAPDVMEMSVVVGFGPQVKALAVRLERSRTPAQGERRERYGTPARGERRAARWVCTAVEAA